MSAAADSNVSTTVARLEAGERAAHRVAAAFDEAFGGAGAALSLVDGGQGRWQIAIHFRDPPDEGALRALVAAGAGAAAAQALTFERIAAKDWIGESLAGLAPVRAGRFTIHGAHDRARVAPNRIGIEIEAALAFGTGHHATTRGCLLALERICRAERRRRLRILDLGTGSGVLAIAVARALRRRVLATDIDVNAVRAARANARRNRAGALIVPATANGVVGLPAHGPFDLVFANILLEPLQRLAAPLIRLVAPEGRIVLSGLLAAQANGALAAYRALALEHRIERDGWTTLVLVRRVRRRAVARQHVRP